MRSIDRQDRPEHHVGLSTVKLQLVCLSSRQGLSSRPLAGSGLKKIQNAADWSGY